MNKDEKLELIVTSLKVAGLTEAEERMFRAGFDRGYSEGFNDGCTAGMRNAAQTQEFVYESLGLK